jgi:hypothetical protein
MTPTSRASSSLVPLTFARTQTSATPSTNLLPKWLEMVSRKRRTMASRTPRAISKSCCSQFVPTNAINKPCCSQVVPANAVPGNYGHGSIWDSFVRQQRGFGKACDTIGRVGFLLKAICAPHFVPGMRNSAVSKHINPCEGSVCRQFPCHQSELV